MKRLIEDKRSYRFKPINKIITNEKEYRRNNWGEFKMQLRKHRFDAVKLYSVDSCSSNEYSPMSEQLTRI